MDERFPANESEIEENASVSVLSDSTSDSNSSKALLMFQDSFDTRNFHEIDEIQTYLSLELNSLGRGFKIGKNCLD